MRSKKEKSGVKAKKRGATKGTVKKYSKVIKSKLMKLTEPTKISMVKFSKENNVTSNLIPSLMNLGYMSKTHDGYKWVGKTGETPEQIAINARIEANTIVNKKEPTVERPSGKRKRNGRKVKRPYNKRKSTAKPESKIKHRVVEEYDVDEIRMQLAEKFTDNGNFEYALKVLS